MTQRLQPIGQPRWPGLSNIGTERFQLETMRAGLLHGELHNCKQYVHTLKQWVCNAEQHRPDGSAFFSWYVPPVGKKHYTNPRAELILASLVAIERLNTERMDPASTGYYVYTLLKDCIEIYETCVFDQLRRWPRCARAGFHGPWIYKHRIQYLNLLKQTNECIVFKNIEDTAYSGLAARIMRQNAEWCIDNSKEQRMYIHMCAMYNCIENFVHPERDTDIVSIANASQKHFGSTLTTTDINPKWQHEWTRLLENVRVLVSMYPNSCRSITKNQLLEYLPKPLDSAKVLLNANNTDSYTEPVVDVQAVASAQPVASVQECVQNVEHEEELTLPVPPTHILQHEEELTLPVPPTHKIENEKDRHNFSFDTEHIKNKQVLN